MTEELCTRLTNKCFVTSEIFQTEDEVLGVDDGRDLINRDLSSPPPENLPDDHQTLHSLNQQIAFYLNQNNYVYYKISRKKWNPLGSMLQEGEKGSSNDIDGTKWISLRLDGRGFSKKIQKLKDSGVLEPNFSITFTKVMAESLKTLMLNWGAIIGFTQSDEMTMLVPPAGLDKKGKPHPHTFKGRRVKLITSCAADLTAIFIANLIKYSGVLDRSPDLLQIILDELLGFDCRCAAYETFAEAAGLLMWRAQDCFKNGMSDHVKHHYAKQHKDVAEMCTEMKMEWLDKINDVPSDLALHGTWLVKEVVEKQAVNRSTNLQVTVQKKQYSLTSLRNVLENKEYPELDCQVRR